MSSTSRDRLSACSAAFACVLAAARSASAAGWPSTDDIARPCRPTISCTADIVPPGTLELEAGAQTSRMSGGTRLVALPFLVKLTLASFVQMQVGSNGYTATNAIPPARYLDDLIVGPKFHVHDQTGLWPSLSASAQISVPLAESVGYLRTYDLFLLAYASKDFGPVHLDANVGANVWRLDRPLAQASGAIALSYALPPPFGVALESYGVSDAAPVSPRDGGVRGVFTLTPRPWCVFDVGGDVGFFPSTRAYTVFAGVTVVPAILW